VERLSQAQRECGWPDRAMIVISKIESIQYKIKSTQSNQLPSLPASELSC
jgi:hypothetical protein